MHIGIFIGEVAVKHFLGGVVLHPDGDFEVAHFLNMGSRHVLGELQVLVFGGGKADSGALCIGQHLHEDMVERSLTVAAHIVVGFLFVHGNEHAGIGINVRHNVGLDGDDVAFHREGASDVHESGSFGVLVENALLDGSIALVFTIEEALWNGAHTVIGAACATFFGIVRVAVARPVHLVLGVGEATSVVVAEGQHGRVDAHAGAAGR